MNTKNKTWRDNSEEGIDSTTFTLSLFLSIREKAKFINSLKRYFPNTETGKYNLHNVVDSKESSRQYCKLG